MELKIIKTNSEMIKVTYAKETLEVGENSTSWNLESINKFLIKLASSTPDKIDLIYNQEDYENDELYKHICNLFQTFVDEFNSKIIQEDK